MTSAHFLTTCLHDERFRHEYDEDQSIIRFYDGKGQLCFTFSVVCRIERADITEISALPHRFETNLHEN